jgi:hypothetical protein
VGRLIRIQAGANPNRARWKGETALVSAAMKNDAISVESLPAAGASALDRHVAAGCASNRHRSKPFQPSTRTEFPRRMTR